MKKTRNPDSVQPSVSKYAAKKQARLAGLKPDFTFVEKRDLISVERER